MTIRDHSFPRESQVAQFVSLHLNTVAVHKKHPHRSDHSIYTVEGKSRPMIVLRKLPVRDRSRTWFLVLPITSKGRDERGNLRDDCVPIGNCINVSIDSYVKLVPERLPDNMLVDSGGKGAILPICDPLGFSNAIKMLERKRLQQGRPDVGA